MRPHLAGGDDRRVDQAPDLYTLRISGHLGPTTLSAFPTMVAQLEGGDTLLTSLLDRSASNFPQNAGYNPTGTAGALAYHTADAIVTRYLPSPAMLA